MDTRICTEQDPFVLERFEWQARWVATLQDGREVYQDDDRYSIEGKRDSSWLRLANYCRENRTFLKNVKLQFRQNEMNFPDHSLYLLTMGAGGEMFGGGVTHNFLILAFPSFNNPSMLTEIWVKTPEMSITRTNLLQVEDLTEEMKNAIIRKN